MNNVLIKKIESISSYYDLAIISLENPNILFSEMYNTYKNYLKNELMKELEVQNTDYDFYDIIQMLNYEKINNVLERIPEFSRFRNPDKIKSYHKKLDVLQNFFGDSENFLREMSLIYLITIFKAYVTDVLNYIFERLKNLLQFAIDTYNKKNKSQINIHDKNSNNDIVRWVTENGIRELSKRLNEIFGFLLSKEKDWVSFIELFDRRNILVHNKGIPTKEYISAYNFPEKPNKLFVTQEYLFNSFEICKKYKEIINKQFINYITNLN